LILDQRYGVADAPLRFRAVRRAPQNVDLALQRSLRFKKLFSAKIAHRTTLSIISDPLLDFNCTSAHLQALLQFDLGL